ncbi:MAG: PQQ-dependent sugar dehydrogenase [Candidatus Nanopelagicales bacterium]|nr:PQQ-dependent sugar dehydrogenase [Candidatus Nanopelagicales bacterium]
MFAEVLLATTLASAPGPVDFQTLTSDLAQPTSVVAGPKRSLLVTEKEGRIVKVQPNGSTSTWFRVRGLSTDGERGLLSMARINNKRFYAAYTNTRGALQVSRFTKGGGERKIIRIKHPDYANHNGGQVALHDGLLYISTGDGGGSGDPFDAARDLKDLRGKILRIDPTCGKRPYCIPASNPKAGDRRILAYGLRNPWRFSIDGPTGQMWIGDVGQDKFEEVDRMPIDGRRFDFGWSCWEGRSRYDTQRCAGRNFTKPVLTYGRSQGGSITGGYVYRGARITSLQGWYVFGDFISGDVWAYKDGRRVRLGQADRVTSFGVDSAGELLLTTIDGTLARLR